MGVGGSTSSRPGSATVLVKSRPPSELPTRRGTAHEISHSHQHNHSNGGDRPTGSCCSHYRKNHATITRTVTPASDSPPAPGDNLDDEIEEIVANTLDAVPSEKTTDFPHGREESKRSHSMAADFNSETRDREVRGSTAGSGIELRRTQSTNTRVVQKRPSDEITEDQDETQYDAKDNLLEVDFAKFKKVNHKGTTIAPNGRIMHHQESDLLWRLGLISPEAYKMNTGPRSAPNQGPYLKTPSYDLTEEQLMANIEKEFEVTTAT